MHGYCAFNAFGLVNFWKAKAAKNAGNKKDSSLFSDESMVDDTRLELVTSRTSSGCATSCANRPCPISKGYSNRWGGACQVFFYISKNYLDFVFTVPYNMQADN